MAATRTQVYLTKEQRAKLDALGASRGKGLATLIREAVDQYIGSSKLERQKEALDRAYGSMPNIRVPSRDEWDRGY